MVIFINFPVKLSLKTLLAYAGLAQHGEKILHCQKVVTVTNAGPEGRKCALETFWHFIVVLNVFWPVHLRPSGISVDTLKTFGAE
jgi:hypothetical protein